MKHCSSGRLVLSLFILAVCSFLLGRSMENSFLSSVPVYADDTVPDADPDSPDEQGTDPVPELPFAWAFVTDEETGTKSVAITEWLEKEADSVTIPVSLVIEEITDADTGDVSWLYDTENGTEYPVTEISDNAFSGLTSLSELIFPENSCVSYIGEYAFSGCSLLTDLHLPSSLSSAAWGFLADSGVEEINIPAALEGSGLLQGSSVTHITLEEGRKTTSENMFGGSPELTGVTLNADLESIGPNTFSSCNKLQDITFSSGSVKLSYIDTNAFYACSALETVSLPDLSLGSNAFSGCSSLAGVTFETDPSRSTRTEIGEYAFNGCTNLSDIQFSDNLGMIDSYAFLGVEKLAVANLPETTLADYAFDSCYGLQTVAFHTGSSYTPGMSIGSYCFNQCSKLKYVTLSDHLTKICDNAFYDLKTLSGTLRIPDCIVGSQAFYGCSGLDEVIFYNTGRTDSHCEIWPNAFYRCTGLMSVQFIEDTTQIGLQAFYGCSSLGSADLPDSLSVLGDPANDVFNSTYRGGVFDSCTSLRTVHLPMSLQKLEDRMFRDCEALSVVELPDGLTEIGESVFVNCSILTGLTIPSRVTSVGAYTFSNCSSLASIHLPDGVTELADGLFFGCSLLRNIRLNQNYTAMGSAVFAGCKSLTSMNISPRIKDLPNSTFSGCTSLTSAGLPETLSSIGNAAFQDCSALTSFAVPAQVQTLGDSAFEACTSLTALTLPEGLLSIGNQAFMNCTRLKSLDIPATVEHMGYRLLAGCGVSRFVLQHNIEAPNYYLHNTLTGETTIYGPLSGSVVKYLYIADGVTAIPDYFYYGGPGYYTNGNRAELDMLQFPESLASIGTSAFTGCATLAAMNFTGDAPAIASDAFTECKLNGYYPAQKSGWDNAQKDYGGEIRWHALGVRNDPEGSVGSNVTFSNTDLTADTITSTDIIKYWAKSDHNLDLNYLYNNQNFLSYQVIYQYDGKLLAPVIEGFADFFFRGTEGWVNLFTRSMSRERAEKLLYAMLLDVQDETEELAQVNACSQTLTALNSGLAAFLSESCESDLVKTMGTLFKTDDDVRKAVNSGSADAIRKALKGKASIPADKLDDLAFSAAEYRWSNTYSSALDVLGYLDKGSNLVNLSAEQYERIVTMQNANDIYAAILQEIASSAPYEPLKDAAENLLTDLAANDAEITRQIVGQLAENAATTGVSAAIDKLIDKYPVTSIAKAGWDIGAGMANFILHTSDTEEIKDAMRVCAAAASVIREEALKQYNEAVRLAFTSESSSVTVNEECTKAIAYAKVLYNVRKTGEESYQKLLANLFKSPANKDAMYQSKKICGHLTEINRYLFDTREVKSYIRTYGFRCPVDIIIRDAAGKTVVTLKDKEEADGTADYTCADGTAGTLYWMVSLNELSDDYEKFVYIPSDADLTLEAVGTAAGQVVCDFTDTGEGGISQYHETMAIPVTAGQKLTMTCADPSAILTTAPKTGSTGNTGSTGSTGKTFRYTLADPLDPSDTPGVEEVKETPGSKPGENTGGSGSTTGKQQDKIPVSSITLTAEPSLKIAAGKKVQLTAAIKPANAANRKLLWSVSNNKYASVSSKGVVTLKKAGKGKTVTITVKAADGSGKKATLKIKIMKGAVKKLTVSGKKTRTLKAGKRLNLKIKIKASKGANKKLKWTTSDKKYASVTAKGVVKTKKAGKGKTVTITASSTDGTKKKVKIKLRLK